MEWNKNRTIGKKEREMNNLPEGPHFRTERKDLKKVQKWPALAPGVFF